MPLYLVRHPEPAGSEGLCYGRKDLAVEPAAIAAAAAAVRSHLGAAVIARAAIYTSPASRCLLLARALAVPRSPCIAEELLEINFGDWEGLAWDDVPRAELDAWSREVWSYRVGGGESIAMVAARWRRWVAALADPSAAAVVVTHAGLIRVALADAASASAKTLLDTRVPFGSVHRIDTAARKACAS